MTLIEKKLLISDLCARLPYGVKVDCTDGVVQLESVDFELGSDKPVFWHNGIGTNLTIEDDNIKPYLFPLSSMTEEQKKELQSLMVHDSYGILYHTIESFDYLYKNKIDFRGLIPMDLAIDATDKNIY